MDMPLPDNVEAAARWLLGGVLIFAFGFESVVMLWEGKFIISACSLLIAVLLTLLLVYWSHLPTIVLVAAVVAVVASIPVVFYGIVKFIRGRKIEKKMLMVVGTFLVVIALIALIAGGALFYVAKTTTETAGGQPPASPTVIHDPPTAEDITKATAPISKERDVLKSELEDLKLRFGTSERERFALLTELQNTKKQLQRIQIQQPNRGLTLTAYDLAKRQETLDDFDRCLNDLGNKTAKFGFGLLERWNEGNGKLTPKEFSGGLTEFRRLLVEYSDLLAATMEKYKRYEDILKISGFDNFDQEMIAATDRLRPELQRILGAYPDDDRPSLLISNAFIEAWRIAVSKFSEGINQKRYRIRQERAKYDAAEIIGK
jgi:hypothetical protein